MDSTACLKTCFIGERPHPGSFDITQRCISLSGLQARHLVFDLGCGDGATVRYLRDLGCSAFGLDRRRTAFRQDKTIRLPLTQADWLVVPLEPSCLDAVFAECTFSLIKDLSALLTEIWRVLKPGGKLVFNGLYSRNPGGKQNLRTIDESCSIYHVQGKQELVDWIEQAGFSVNIWEDHSFLLQTHSYQAQIFLWNRGMFHKQEAIAATAHDVFDLFLDVARLKLGYYAAVAEKQ